MRYPAPNPDRSCLRIMVALLAVGAGGALAALDVWWGISAIPQALRGQRGELTPAEQRILFGGCVSLFGVAYAVGRILYRLLGATAEAEELKGWSRWHMVALNVIGAGYLIADGWGAPRPSLIAALVMLGSTLFDSWKGRRDQRDALAGEPDPPRRGS